MAPHHLPFFITSPGETDALMIVTGIILIVAVFAVGLLYWHLHSLPERMAHKTQKLQFEIVAVLGLIALFTHEHLYWIAALVLALIELPDFGTPLRSIAGSVEKIADGAPPKNADELSQPNAGVAPVAVGRNEHDLDAEQKVRSHA
ncbi:hypothetical protein XH88_11005 [Bradyrhizobium sp. CCBAU 51627]|nr:hypothetical protein [Bradyrhizobium sp. CCBAU 51627]